MLFNGARTSLVAISFSLMCSGLTFTAAHAEEYSFKATNSTNTTITKILVSENKRKWGYFDIGRGIKPGATTKLVWDQSTNSENCTQWVKAVFADDSESEPAKFDFCESGLEIEF